MKNLTDHQSIRAQSLRCLERINAKAIDLSAGRLEQMDISDEDREEFDRGARTALQLLRLAITAGDLRAQHMKEQSADEQWASEERLSDDRLGELVREYDEKLNRIEAGDADCKAEKDCDRNSFGRRGL